MDDYLVCRVERILPCIPDRYLSLFVDDCLVCIPESHPHRVTNIKCRIDTVISPDDGHLFARNMYRKEINMIRKIVHQVGLIYKIIQGCAVNKTLKFTLKRLDK